MDILQKGPRRFDFQQTEDIAFNNLISASSNMSQQEPYSADLSVKLLLVVDVSQEAVGTAP